MGDVHPDSPKALALSLGLTVDTSRYLSPAIVGETGKRHYYKHGGGILGRHEATDVLRRLIRMKARRNPPAPAYRTELTPIGEQLVIPGCEKNLAPGARQLDLF